MVNCGVCNKVCDENAGIKCAGTCDRVFHLECVKKSRTAKKDWYCDNCKQQSSTSSKVDSASTAITKEFFIKTIEGVKAEIFRELRSSNENNTREFTEIRTSLSFMNDLLEKTQQEISDLSEENRSLRKENADLRISVDEIDKRLRNLEQYSRQANIEISGVPETAKENMEQVLEDVAKAVDVELMKERVVAAHRVPTFNGRRPAPIVVKFISRLDRDRWIDGFKRVRPLTAEKINPRLASKEKVFINEHLTPETKRLLKATKEAAKDKHYSYVWCKEGKIFVRKQDGARCKRIDSRVDLEKL